MDSLTSLICAVDDRDPHAVALLARRLAHRRELSFQLRYLLKELEDLARYAPALAALLADGIEEAPPATLRRLVELIEGGQE
jgi:hypothetical protein